MVPFLKVRFLENQISYGLWSIFQMLYFYVAGFSFLFLEFDPLYYSCIVYAMANCFTLLRQWLRLQ